MNPLQTLLVAASALWRNKLRSFLTALGIVIGVAAVVAMVAIGEGAKKRVEQSYESMGTNLLFIQPGSTSRAGTRGGFGSMPTLTWQDLDAIGREIPAVRHAAAQLRSTSMVMGAAGSWTTAITGTTEAFFAIRNWPVVQGTLFTGLDVDAGAKVAVLGKTVVEQLFGPGYDPVGETIRIRNVPFQVIGVLGSKGQSAGGQDNDDAIFIPQTTFQAKIQGGLNKFLSGGILLSVSSPQELAVAQEQITLLLRDRHRLGPEKDDDFSIRNLTEMANARQEGTQTMTLLLASIAAVSLLVGGIGVMNIMLVSVTERTREIGLRMAVGATPEAILAQFLAEAVSLAVIGGILGVLLGAGAAIGLAQQFNWPVFVRPDVAAIAVAFSALVGIGFGLYPARKASLLNPIEALRYE